MGVGERFTINEATAAILLCAKCKQRVPSGHPHECSGVSKVFKSDTGWADPQPQKENNNEKA